MKRKSAFLFVCCLAFLWACNNSKNETEKTSAGLLPGGPSKGKQVSDAFFFDVLEKNDTNKLNEILADNFISYDYPEPDANSDKANFIKSVIELLKNISDMKVHIEAQAEKDNMIFTAGYFTFKHSGVLAGVPATNKTIKVDFQDIWQEENGKIVKNWVVMDRLGMLQQIGAIPFPGK